MALRNVKLKNVSGGVTVSGGTVAFEGITIDRAEAYVLPGDGSGASLYRSPRGWFSSILSEV